MPTKYLVNLRRSGSSNAISPRGRGSAFHRRLPGYAPTPLVDLPGVAARLGVRGVLAKLETDRFGLPSFKALGASYAAYRALVARLGEEPDWSTLAELGEALRPLRPLTLRTATDGNHGRAVAWFARQVGLDARVFVPAGTAAARIDAIEGEGAQVEVVDGTYDLAVAVAARFDERSDLVVSDTSWPGYEDIPRWVSEGYLTIFAELDDQLDQLDQTPSLLAVQLGVGALGAAAAMWAEGRPLHVLGVEPSDADCVRTSILHDRITEVPGPHRSSMAGLNCGLPSPVALPFVRDRFDGFIAIGDPPVCDATRALDEEGVVAGETGAAGLAGLFETKLLPRLREAINLTPEALVVTLVTEGATDPAAYERIVSVGMGSVTPRERSRIVDPLRGD